MTNTKNFDFSQRFMIGSGLRYPRPSAYTLEDIAIIRMDVARKFGVTIGTTID